MSKSTTLTKVALGLLCLFGGTIAAQAQQVAQTGESLNLTQTSYYTYTPTASGTLTATMPQGLFSFGGAPDNILYTGISGKGTEDEPYSGTGEVAFASYSEPEGMYVKEVSWKVNGNTEYYLYFSGSLTLTLSFVQGEVGPTQPESNIIQEGVPFKSNNKVWKYTPEQDGLLTISTDTYYRYQFSQNQAGLLFTAEDHNDNSKVAISCVDQDAEEAVYTCPVTGQTDYYLFNDVDGSIEFIFKWSEMPAPAIATVAPEPGMAFDGEGDYGNGVLISFNPVDVTFESASISYTGVTSGEITKQLTKGENGLEGDDYAYNQNGTWKFQSVTMAYNGYDQNNITWEAAKPGSEIVLTLTNATYNGKPVSQNETGYTDGIEVSADGTIKLTWYKPAEEFKLLSQNWPTSLSSYIAPGSENGYATLTFNMDVKTVGTHSLIFLKNFNPLGNGEKVFAQYEIPIEIEGPVVKLNFTNKDFTALENYNGANSDKDAVSVFVNGIVSADGQNGEQIVKTNIPYSEAAADQKATIMSTPATMVSPGEYATSIQNVVLEWQGETIGFTSTTGFAWISKGDGSPTQCEVSIVNNQLVIGVPSSVKSRGIYTITLPENTVKNEKEEVNKDEIFNITVVGANQGTWNITDSESYLPSELSSVSLSFGNYVLSAGYSDAEIILIQGESKQSLTPVMTDSSLTFNLSELQPGDYTISVPEGYVWLTQGSLTNAASGVNFSVASPLENFDKGAVILPEDGNEYVIELEGVTLQWPFELSMVSDVVYVNVSVDGGEATKVNAVVEAVEGSEITTLSVDLSTYTEYGIYTVELPQGQLKDGEGKVNMAQTVEISYFEVNNNYKTNPEAGEIESDALADGIYVVWTDANSIVLNETCTSSITWAGFTTPVSAPEGKNYLWIAGNDEMAPGEYTLVIPATKVIIDGMFLNDEIVVKYTVEEDESVLAQPTMVYADNKVYIYYTETIEAASDNTVLEATVITPDNKTEKVALAIESFTPENAGETYTGNALVGDLTSVLDTYGVGKYSVSIAAGMVMNGEGLLNGAFSASVEISSTGIDALKAAAAEGGVYNLKGVKVSNDLNNLKNGIYIINGKKVMIRK